MSACGSSENTTQTRVDASALISDQAHNGGTPGFFFLPPMVRATTYGVYRPGLAPVVTIEELAPGTRGIIATFTTTSGTSGARVEDDGVDHYQVNWDTRLFALDPTLTYRIHVSLENFELGFADVDLVASGSELKTVATNESIPLLDGRTFPIKFRIQPEALLCVGVVCGALDQCHVAGKCDPRTGACSAPAAANGTSCDDGNACTQTDSCQAGACTGANPVACGVADQCHAGGACDPATGTCSTAGAIPDGSSCDDGRAETTIDVCSSGACIGTSSGGLTTPQSIALGAGLSICAGGSQSMPVGLTLPAGSVIDKVDVFLLFDDTGSFAGVVPTVTSIFSQLVGQLQSALPQVSFGFGVGRFEDYGGPATGFTGEYSTGRAFTLNQPIVTPEVEGFLTLINAALGRTAPGFGGDGPEGAIEALKQIATGSGFDGNGNESTLDSGPAGAVSTQTSPGTSGDIPEFSSNVAPTSGSLGGVGFRPGALHLVINATDICPVAVFPPGQPVPSTLTGAGGVTVPTSALLCSSQVGVGRFGYVSNSLSASGNTVPGAIAPRGSATDPETIAALNALGVSVIGLAPGGIAIENPVGPSGAPSVWLSAMALLTGATDASGHPLVFDVSGGAVPIRDAIIQAVTAAATRPRDVSLAFSGLPSGLTGSFTPPVVAGVGPGGSATFSVTFDGDGSTINGAFDILFVDVSSNATLGTLPVTIACGP